MNAPAPIPTKTETAANCYMNWGHRMTVSAEILAGSMMFKAVTSGKPLPANHMPKTPSDNMGGRPHRGFKSKTKGIILAWLRDNGEASVSDVPRAIGVAGTTASQHLRMLRVSGHVWTKPGPEGRRISNLTDIGREAVAE